MASGFTMYHLAKHYASPHIALLASAFYIANPYMLFCAFERTAFAELLAAAWIPLLFLAVLRPRPTVHGIAIPIALLWLTNAPAAVMGCYTFALIATLRVTSSFIRSGTGLRAGTLGYPEASASGLITSRKRGGFSPGGLHPLNLTLTYTLGTLLGLALPAFYLIPAAYERRFVQVAMAIIPNMRYQDNFLFTNTADAAHNAVNHTASTLAITILALTITTIAALCLQYRKKGVPEQFVISTEAQSAQWRDLHLEPAPLLIILTLLIAFLLTPLSTPIWAHLPNLPYLQFPWRLLTILSCVLTFSLTLLLNRVAWTSSLSSISYLVSPLLFLALTFTAYHLYAQACDHPSLPTSIATLFSTGHGAPPTDEYTPTDADNDHLRTNNPGYWLATDLNSPAPNTTPTAAELNPNIATDDTPIPDSQTLSTPAPHHITITTATPQYLILNLRDYPNWQVSRTNPKAEVTMIREHAQRGDGLLAIALTEGTYNLDITWHRTLDQTLSLITSALALIALALTYLPRHQSPSRNSATIA
jgi:hypothetical protein